MKILIINPHLDLAEYIFNAPPLSCLGPLYSAAYLRKFHDISMVDSFVLEGAVPPRGVASVGKQKVRLGAPFSDVLREVAEQDTEFDAVIINKARWWSHEKQSDRADFFKKLRELQPKTRMMLADMFIGDLYLPPYDPRDYLKNYPELDCVVHGAGEQTLKTILESDQDQENPGLAFRDRDGHLHFNGYHYSNNIKNLDDIPQPAYDILGAPKYVRFFREAELSNLVQENHEGLAFLGLMASRGCNHKCSFCALPRYKIPYRHHSMEYLEHALMDMATAGDIKKFVFADTVVNQKRTFLKSLLKFLVDNEFRFSFPNGVRADRLDDEMIRLFKHGSSALITSIETPDPKFLKSQVHKSLKPEKVTELAQKCFDMALPLYVHYVVGMPGESVEDVNNTLSYAVSLYENYGAFPLVQIATPIPGTEMYEVVNERGFLDAPPEEIARNLPVLFQNRSVINTPELSAQSTTNLYQRFHRYIIKQHPREVTLVMSYDCNNKCRHCMVRNLSVKKNNVKEMQKTIDEAVERGIKTLVIEGGEPTLQRELVPIIRYARSVGISEVMMESNGRMCARPEYAKLLAQSGVTMLFITVQGPDEKTHDKVTRAPKSFQQTLLGIRNLLASGMQSLAVNLPLHKAMIRDGGLKKAISVLRSLGVRRFMLQYPTPFGSYHGKTSALPTYAEAVEAFKEAVEDVPKNVDVLVMNIPFCMLQGYEEHVHPDVNNSGTLPLNDEQCMAITTMLEEGKIKDQECKTCEYSFLCTGFLESQREN